MEFLALVRAVLGFVYVLFIPGFVASWAFFPGRDEIDWVERIALTMGLSIALSTIPVMALNYVGVLVNEVNVFIIILAVTVFFGIIAVFRVRRVGGFI
jgi:uncharacterized membrane protein